MGDLHKSLLFVRKRNTQFSAHLAGMGEAENTCYFVGINIWKDVTWKLEKRAEG